MGQKCKDLELKLEKASLAKEEGFKNQI